MILMIYATERAKVLKIIHTFTAVRIYLIGYMASGKTHLGRKLAEKLGYGFVDLDQLFEERYRISVKDFFGKYDEWAFRSIERSLLVETTGLENVVVATGGGTPCFFDNMDVIRKSGFSIYLRWEVPDLVRRLHGVKKKRPLLKDTPPEELEGKVRDALDQRSVFYEQANLVVSGSDADPAELMALINYPPYPLHAGREGAGGG
jgi:shikimate kinase